MNQLRGSNWGMKMQILRWNQEVAETGTDLAPSHMPPTSSGADNTAAVHTQHVGFNRQEQDVFFLPILVVDSGPPTLSSTGTLTIRVCGCDSSGAIQSCNTTAFVMATSLSPGALIALLVCVLILVGESTESHPPVLIGRILGFGFPSQLAPMGPPFNTPTTHTRMGWPEPSPSPNPQCPKCRVVPRGTECLMPTLQDLYICQHCLMSRVFFSFLVIWGVELRTSH
jgi:hypothetical protein